jgi:hypothetical protein
MSSNPLVVNLPYNFVGPDDYPTEQLANRFNAWRSIIKDLVTYFREYASVQQEIVSQQKRLQQVVGTSHDILGGGGDTETNKVFLPTGNGSIQDIPMILSKFHHMNITNSSKTLKEINGVIIPKLEDLRRDLVVKIKEIKNLQNDFKTNLGNEIQTTKQLLSKYETIMERATKESITSSASSITSSSHHLHDSNSQNEDPYLIKLKLDRQLKRQISEENYLYQAYSNLQNAGSKLESIIVLEVQNYMGIFLNLLNEENSSVPNYLVPNFSSGFLSKEANFEWDSYISRNLPKKSSSINSKISGTFIDLDIPVRKLSDLYIDKSDSILNFPIKEGMLERRSKFLKSYSQGYYVLTCEYIHEFKSADRKKDQVPVMSLSLDSCTVTEHSRDSASGPFKFILSSKQSNGLIHRSHNWVFRTNTYREMIDWYNDIKQLTGLPNPSARGRFIEKRDGKHTTKYSTATSVLSGNSIKSKSPPASIKRPMSQNTTNRLSSTFSQNNKQSPRLTNMINSDGTIITPVDTFDENAKHKEQYSNAGSVRKMYSPVANHATSTPGSVHLHPHAQDPQMQHISAHSQSQTPQMQPSQGHQPQQMQYFVPPVPYMINQGPPQQFYDPVQQQYFQITPVNGNANDAASVQPQYFPASPNPGLGQGNVPRPASPTFVVLQYQTPTQPLHSPSMNSQKQFGEFLPYPANESHTIHQQHEQDHVEHQDEVSTLQSKVDNLTVDDSHVAKGKELNENSIEKVPTNLAEAGNITIAD